MSEKRTGDSAYLRVEFESKFGAWRSSENLPHFIDPTIDTAPSLTLAVCDILESRLEDGSALSRVTKVAWKEAVQRLQERRRMGGDGSRNTSTT